MFLRIAPLLDGNTDTPLKRKFIANTLEMFAEKNMTLSRRIFCSSPKNIRARVMNMKSTFHKYSKELNGIAFVVRKPAK